MQHQHTAQLINQWAAEGRPFFFMVDFEGQSPVVLPLQDLEKEEVFVKIGNLTRYPDTGRPLPANWSFAKKPIPFPIYAEGFREVMAEIKHGNTFLLNLTYPTPIETTLSLRDIFRKSRARYKLLYKDQFVVFSPEIFVKIDESGLIRSFPMKGTIDANLPDAEATLLADPKEIAEHYTIVDLIRNDLSMVATEVEVKRFRYVEKISTHDKDLLQISSEIEGKLPTDWKNRLGDTLMTLLPAGSISGAPKKMTIDIIRRAELGNRGYYTGIFGVFDGHSLDSAVMIRYIEHQDDGLIFRSGGGITFSSTAKAEYQELIDKVYLPIPSSPQTPHP